MASSFTESLATFTKSVAFSFKEVEKRAEAAQIARDDALRTLHQRELELRERELEIQEWKLKVKQLEHTNVQQAETISLLRRELSQSRDQTANWQEHFLRVEQQRCTLTSRLDELVSERRPSAPTLPLSPVSRYDEPVVQQLKTPAKSKPPISTLALKQSATPNTLAEPTTQPRRPVQTKLVRRVQATYEIKAESDEEDQLSAEEQSRTPVASSHRRIVESDSGDEFDDDDEGDEDELMIGPDAASLMTKNRRNLPPQPVPQPPVKKRKAVRAPTKPGPAKKRS